MKQEQVLAGLRTILAKKQRYTTWTVSTPHLVALVNKFVQDERAACCVIVYEQCESDNVAQRTVDAIRARGTT